jgi:hypothetical protein
VTTKTEKGETCLNTTAAVEIGNHDYSSRAAENSTSIERANIMIRFNPKLHLFTVFNVFNHSLGAKENEM